MKFGIFYEFQIPRPWENGDEHRLFKNGLDQVELADKLGFDYVWQAEHHFLEEYSHSSAPEVFLAAASQRTKRIRLGHGIVQLTTNHPARVAERAATLDLISDGRLELGLGEGATTSELHPFNVRYRDKRRVWEDAVRCIVPMFWNDRWEYHGEYFDFPARNVLPKPLQKPHPPLWVACSQMDTIRAAGAWGMGVLGSQFLTPEAAAAWVNAYYNEYTKRPNRLAEYQPNPNIAVFSYFMCAPTDEEAQAKADGASFFEFALGFYGKYGPFEPGQVDFWEEYQAWRKTEKGQERARWLHDHALVGSPATIRQRLEQFERYRVDQVVLLNQSGRTTHADICDSLRLFAAELLPEFQGRDHLQQEWKQAVLAGDIELAELSTDGFDRAAMRGLTKAPAGEKAAESAADRAAR